MVSAAAPRATGRCWQPQCLRRGPCAHLPCCPKETFRLECQNRLGKLAAWEKLAQAGGGVEVFRGARCKTERYESPRSAAEFLFIAPINQYV